MDSDDVLVGVVVRRPPPRGVRLTKLSLGHANVGYDMREICSAELAGERLLIEVDETAESGALLGSDDGVSVSVGWLID